MSKKRAVQGLMSLVRKDVKRKAEVEFLKNHNVSQSTLDNDFFRSNYQPRYPTLIKLLLHLKKYQEIIV